MWYAQLFLGMALAVCIAVTASAADKFSFQLTPGYYSGRYDGSKYRDRIQGAGANIEGQFAARWGFAAGYEHTRIKYKLQLPVYRQNAVFLSSHVSYIPQHALASYIFRLDFHSVNDDDGEYSADDARVIAPQVSYQRDDNSLYLDLGYADSRYGTNPYISGALRIQQWTPTLGIALTRGGANWLKLRGYFNHSDNRLRSQNKKDTAALEAKYMYHPLSSYKLVPQFFEAGVLVGERIYTVDRDTASVANLADLEKDGMTLSAQWRLTKSLNLLVVGSRSQFREQTYTGYNDYFQKSVWLGLVTRW
ncbi:MAG: hypothetical protein PVF82_09940 [Gammaproteobacteria bacterium]|jgi:hypothetical protein